MCVAPCDSTWLPGYLQCCQHSPHISTLWWRGGQNSQAYDRRNNMVPSCYLQVNRDDAINFFLMLAWLALHGLWDIVKCIFWHFVALSNWDTWYAVVDIIMNREVVAYATWHHELMVSSFFTKMDYQPWFWKGSHGPRPTHPYNNWKLVKRQIYCILHKSCCKGCGKSYTYFTKINENRLFLLQKGVCQYYS